MATNLPGRNSEPIRHTHTTNENGERWEHLAETCPYTHRSLGVCLRTLTPTAVAWKSSWEGVLCGMLGRSRPFNVFEQSARIKARFPWDRPACTQEGSRVDAAFARRWDNAFSPSQNEPIEGTRLPAVVESVERTRLNEGNGLHWPAKAQKKSCATFQVQGENLGATFVTTPRKEAGRRA